MGTFVSQEIYGIDGAVVSENVCRELCRLDTLWSPYRPGNIVDSICKSAGVCAISTDSDTLEILSVAKEIGILSKGSFDITVDPVTQLWRKASQMKCPPDQHEIDAVRHLVCIEQLKIGPDNDVYLFHQGQSIDLGGIGKGYGADRAREIYEAAGIRHATINIGGNVLVMGCKPNGSPWKVGIKNPLNPDDLVGYIEAENCSVVTSGDYEQFFSYTDNSGTERYHHIIDPRTGRPAITNVSGVTVMSPSSTLCDALATAAFILGVEQGMRLCDSFDNTHSLFIDKDGGVNMSSGMTTKFTPLNLVNKMCQLSA